MFKNTRLRVIIYFLVAVLLTGKYIISPDKSLAELSPKYAATPSKFMSLNGMNIHYRDQGEGAVIVLIHGTGASLHTWEDWTQDLISD